MLTVSSVLAMYLVRFAWRLEHFARHPLVVSPFVYHGTYLSRNTHLFSE